MGLDRSLPARMMLIRASCALRGVVCRPVGIPAGHHVTSTRPPSRRLPPFLGQIQRRVGNQTRAAKGDLGMICLTTTPISRVILRLACRSGSSYAAGRLDI